MQMTTSPFPTEAEAQVRYGYLRTIGRVSGTEREIEIWFVVDDEKPQRLLLLSEHQERANWVRNARKQPAVRFRIGERIWHGTVSGVADEALGARIREAVHAKYRNDLAEPEMSTFITTALPMVIDLGDVEEHRPAE